MVEGIKAVTTPRLFTSFLHDDGHRKYSSFMLLQISAANIHRHIVRVKDIFQVYFMLSSSMPASDSRQKNARIEATNISPLLMSNFYRMLALVAR